MQAAQSGTLPLLAPAYVIATYPGLAFAGGFRQGRPGHIGKARCSANLNSALPQLALRAQDAFVPTLA